MASSIYFVFLAIVIECIVSANSSENIDNLTDVDRKFRTLKYDDIWKKAVKKLSTEDLKSLGRILRKLDKSEITLKHLKAKGDNSDKSLEQTIRSHLADTLERYGLDEGPNRKYYEDRNFEDARLNRMWMQALKEGDYSAGELHALHEEIDHMQAKMKDYHLHSEKVEHLRKKLKDEKIDGAEAHFMEPTHGNEKTHPKHLKQMMKEQKDKYHHLNDHVRKLEEEVSNRVYNPGVRFTDSRVVDLWKLAKSSGKFNEDELQGIENDLSDFQNRISKLRHWERIHDNLRDSEAGEDYENAKKQIESHKKYVKKYHATMMERVYQHIEL